MARINSLRTQVYEFAGRIQKLLTTTVAEHAQITGVLLTSTSAIVGHLVTKDEPQAQHFPLIKAPGARQCEMLVSFLLELDDSGDYLMSTSSVFAVAVRGRDGEGRTPMFHMDYEREKADGYPEAHLQLHGDLPALRLLQEGTDTNRPLDKLHFPVGGRRFRPALEDVVEFLIVEKLVKGRMGWQSVVEASRKTFYEIQLKAAVRRTPEPAAAALRQILGWKVEAPD